MGDACVTGHTAPSQSNPFIWGKGIKNLLTPAFIWPQRACFAKRPLRARARPCVAPRRAPIGSNLQSYAKQHHGHEVRMPAWSRAILKGSVEQSDGATWRRAEIIRSRRG